jgi:hypothetical protein
MSAIGHVLAGRWDPRRLTAAGQQERPAPDVRVPVPGALGGLDPSGGDRQRLPEVVGSAGHSSSLRGLGRLRQGAPARRQ